MRSRRLKLTLALALAVVAPAAARADDPDGETKKRQVCEANFYGGELALQAEAKDDATRLFRLAAAGCSPATIQWSAANAELRALGAP